MRMKLSWSKQFQPASSSYVINLQLEVSRDGGRETLSLKYKWVLLRFVVDGGVGTLD